MTAQEASLVRQYKQVLASVLPAEWLTTDGLLKKPDGQGEQIVIRPQKPKTLWQRIGLARDTQAGAFYQGGLCFKIARHYLEQYRRKLRPEEYEDISNFLAEQLRSECQAADVISLDGQRLAGAIVHETFHDIQGYLLDYYPEIFNALNEAMQFYKPAIKKWFEDPTNYSFACGRNYAFHHIFPLSPSNSPYGDGLASSIHLAVVKGMRSRGVIKLISPPLFFMTAEVTMALGMAEGIPQLLGAASHGNERAADILASIFEHAGLRKDFYTTLPRLAGFTRRRK